MGDRVAAYYNDNDPFVCEWLRNLIAEGHIAPGEVDERSILEVSADDLRGFTQVHLFAGIGVWSYSLRLAGWPDDKPVWTGSCPCPPFSSAGKQKACPGCGGLGPVPHVVRTGVFVCCHCGHEWVADERHIWPEFARLVYDCRPDTVLGEQVASADGRIWIDIVCSSFEIMDYAAVAVDTSSAIHGAPHIRQRLRFAAHNLRPSASGLADTHDTGLEGLSGDGFGRGEPGRDTPGPDGSHYHAGVSGGVDDATGARHIGTLSNSEGDTRDSSRMRVPDTGCPVERLDDSDGRERGGVADQPRTERNWADPRRAQGHSESESPCYDVHPGPTNGFWRDADWLLCRDGKWRPVEPGTFPLAHGASARVGRLRAYGNAVDAQATRGFIEAVMECGL